MIKFNNCVCTKYGSVTPRAFNNNHLGTALSLQVGTHQ